MSDVVAETGWEGQGAKIVVIVEFFLVQKSPSKISDRAFKTILTSASGLQMINPCIKKQNTDWPDILH